MASDQPKSASETPDSPEAQLPALVVDPAVLGTAARLLDDLPGPHSPTVAAPTADAIGGTKLANEIHAFPRRYRDVASSLAVDNDTTAAHLANAATAYSRADTRVAALLTEAAQLLAATPDSDESDDTATDSTARLSTDRQI